jgi:hypothetical protein
MASSSSGYVVVPRYFAAHMRVYMRGLCLLGVLCGDVPCPPHPIDLVAPVPPTLSVIARDASEVNRIAIEAYDQKVVDFSETLSAYRDAQSAYTQWCDEDARAMAVLTASVMPEFFYEFMGLGTVSEILGSPSPSVLAI